MSFDTAPMTTTCPCWKTDSTHIKPWVFGWMIGCGTCVGARMPHIGAVLHAALILSKHRREWPTMEKSLYSNSTLTIRLHAVPGSLSHRHM
jgi:hypothetical protein